MCQTNCFIDFSKSFDKVNYRNSLIKLLIDKLDSSIIGIMAFWYSHQQIRVLRWLLSFKLEMELEEVGSGLQTFYEKYKIFSCCYFLALIQVVMLVSSRSMFTRLMMINYGVDNSSMVCHSRC